MKNSCIFPKLVSWALILKSSVLVQVWLSIPMKFLDYTRVPSSIKARKEIHSSASKGPSAHRYWISGAQFSCVLGLTAGLVFFLVPHPVHPSWFLLCISGDWSGLSSWFVPCCSCESCYSPVSFLICRVDFHWGAPWLLDTLLVSSPSAPGWSYYFGVCFRTITRAVNILDPGKYNTHLETNEFQGELPWEFVRISMFCRIYDIARF